MLLLLLLLLLMYMQVPLPLLRAPQLATECRELSERLGQRGGRGNCEGSWVWVYGLKTRGR